MKLYHIGLMESSLLTITSIKDMLLTSGYVNFHIKIKGGIMLLIGAWLITIWGCLPLTVVGGIIIIPILTISTLFWLLGIWWLVGCICSFLIAYLVTGSEIENKIKYSLWIAVFGLLGGILIPFGLLGTYYLIELSLDKEKIESTNPSQECS
ncbi:MAG: hypothetical protein KAR54_02735 [Candidatus Pacebacteria bacterium]|nr:hypothetical protein [Candidatus Paceibacterota bacterium]